MLPLEVLAGTTTAKHAEPASFEELTDQAEELRGTEDFAKSARSFAAAFRTLAEEDRVGLKGEITVNNAVDDFRLAQEQDPPNVALLEDELAVLQQLERERESAHGRGRAEAVPAGIIDERVRVETALDELQRRKDEEEAAAAAAAAAANEPELTPIEPESAPRPNRKADVATLAIGIVSIAGGSALIASGVWNIGNVDRRGSELLATIDESSGGSQEMRDALRGEVEGWQRQWRGIGTGLAVGGGVLTAVGLGLTTLGAVRMARGRRRPDEVKTMGPMLLERGAGFSLTTRF